MEPHRRDAVRCAYCQAAATLIVTGRGTGPIPYRASVACPADIPKARAWAARASPPHETPITDEREITTLF